MSGSNGLQAQHLSETAAKRRRWHLSWRSFIVALSAIYILYCVIYVVDLLPIAFTIAISGPQHLGFFLGIILFLAYLTLPAKKKAARNKPQWYDIILAILSLVPTAYYAVFFETKLFELEFSTPINTVFGSLLMALVWEAARRALGWPFASIIAVAILYLLFGGYLPGIIQTDFYSFKKIAGFMYVSNDGIFGVPLSIAGRIIVTFLLFAQVLFVSGVGDWFVSIANSVTGHLRGGPAKGSIIASAGFGMISASVAGNVASTGVVTIPLMKKTGFKPEFAAGVEAVASTGGQIMPPVMGSVVFILCEYIGIPYGKVIIYAFLPAVLYYLALFLMVDFNAGKRGLHGLSKAELPSFLPTVKQGYWYLIPIMVLLICLIGLSYSPEKSAIWALFSLIVISMFRRKERIGFRKLIQGAELAMKSLVPVAVGCAGVGMVIGALSLSLLSYRLTFELVEMSGGSLIIILIIAAVISYIIGMGVGPLVSYLTLAMMVAPAVTQAGVPALAAHLFLVYWAITCFITPPYAMAAFVAAGIADCGLWQAGFQAMRLGVGTFIVPFIFVYKPALLWIGSPLEIIVVALTSVIGIASIAAGMEGYILGKLNWLQRILLAVGGTIFALASGPWQIIAGTAIIIAVLWHLISLKGRRPAIAPE